MADPIFPSIDPAAIAALNQHLHGQLLFPGDEEYDTSRRVFNAMIDKRPAVIVRPADAEDVRRAVMFAREQGLPISVKGGGHNVAGNAVSVGGVTIDSASLKGIKVDPDRRVAVADAGLLLSDLDQATQAHGLSTPVGVVSVTGIAGLTLGGGVGWLNGKYGLACDNLIGAEIVTADGDLLSVSDDEHADLMWGLRGGSGNFGIVTSFTYRLHPVGPILAGDIAFPPDRAREAFRAYHEFAASCPDELSMTAGPGIDGEGRPTFGTTVCWCGPHDEGERALRPLRALGPTTDTVKSTDFCALQSAKDGGYPRGRLHYWKSSYLTDLTDDLMDVLYHFAATKPSPATGIGMQQLHGAAARVAPTATAFPHRRIQHELLMLSQWSDPADSERNIAWTRAFFEAVKPYAARGVYVNDLGDEGEDRVREAFGANYERLASLKAKYDPTNLFQSTQNIKPAG